MDRMRMAVAGGLMMALATTAGCAGMREGMGMDRMNSSERMGAREMSAADRQMMASCMAMTHEQMMANRRCAEMAKKHPEMHNNPK